VLPLDWRVVYRDSIWYGASVVMLTVFLWDGYMEAYEAGLLFAMYILYLAVMKYNKVRSRAARAHGLKNTHPHPTT